MPNGTQYQLQLMDNQHQHVGQKALLFFFAVIGTNLSSFTTIACQPRFRSHYVLLDNQYARQSGSIYYLPSFYYLEFFVNILASSTVFFDIRRC